MGIGACPRQRSSYLLILLAMVPASTTLPGCGGDSPASDTSTITILETAFPDYLDPALSYRRDVWQGLAQVYPGLYVFPHESGRAGAIVRPGLAAAMPTISADGRSYLIRLRPGLRFSDGAPLRASDFKATIERVLAMDSQGSGLGFTNIVGATRFQRSKRGGLVGISVNDASGAISIRLVAARGSFTYELAVPFAGIVPAGTPRRNQTQTPPPGAGRYVIRAVRPNRSYRLVRNPKFSRPLEGTAVDAGRARGFTVRVVPSLANATTQVSRNQADFMIDGPPPDRIGEVRRRFPDRYRQFATASNFYFFMNSEAAPFDDVRVRRAVNYAISPAELNKIQGGVIVPAHTIIPPGVPGHEDSPTLYPHNLERAKALVRAAGATGSRVTVWGLPVAPVKGTVEYLADVLDQIGLRARVRTVPAETYFATIGDRSLHAQIGWANWFEDYPHPADFIDIPLNPSKIVATGNNNYSYNAADRGLAARINSASTRQLTPATQRTWAAIDREIQRKAYWALYGNARASTFMSERMDFAGCRGDDWPLAGHDWAQFCVK
jgi:peptide/nickel transport system substrate-binding protein